MALDTNGANVYPSELDKGSSHGMYYSVLYHFVENLDLNLGACFVNDRRLYTSFSYQFVSPDMTQCLRKRFNFLC